MLGISVTLQYIYGCKFKPILRLVQIYMKKCVELPSFVAFDILAVLRKLWWCIITT